MRFIVMFVTAVCVLFRLKQTLKFTPYGQSDQANIKVYTLLPEWHNAFAASTAKPS